jgi:ABC-type uncharacterized transport system permease subunit
MSTPPEAPPSAGPSLATFYERAGGFVVPLAATVLAFVIGGLVVAFTGHNPFTAYKAIFDGTGLNWFFPWVQGAERTRAAASLEQTLILMTPLILTALAVAFAFRCGLFNIGGQGQYWVGLIAAIWIGTHMSGLSRPLHVLLGLLAAIAAGALWGGIAGLLKATTGAHEVISTIMLNWIAIYGGSYLFELNGPLQGSVPSLPRSAVIDDSARLWPVWKMEGVIQVLHAGIFIALFALIVYYIILNRTTLGFEIRAVGYNPEAARYSGISVARNYFLALAISGAFAGLAGGLDILGYKFAVDTSDFATNQVGFTGIAVALLGRNKPVGILFSALLFAGLQTGTSTRALDPSIFDPALATDLATIIQALVIFFVGAELLIFYIWRARRYLPMRGSAQSEAQV